MEHAVEETMDRIRKVYEMVTGQPAPEFSSNSPYARIPPEVDREEHVLRQAAALFERVRELGQKNGTPHFGSDVVSKPVHMFGDRTISAPLAVYREGNELRFVFDVGPTSRERISVELQGTELRVSSERPDSTVERVEQKDTLESDRGRRESITASRARVTQTALLPARVDPSVVTAELTDGFLTVRVRMPLFDDAIHKIEIR